MDDAQALVRQSTKRLRAEMVSERGGRYPDPELSDHYRRKNPDTRNPPPDELTFKQAATDRDVASRLDRLTTQGGSGVLIPGEKVRGEVASIEGVKITTLTLEDALRLSQQSGREFLSAQEDYLLAAISLLIERHQWGPRFFDDISTTLSASGDDGNFEPALRLVNSLRATQRLPYGGSVEAAWVWTATEQLREQATTGYASSSSIVLSGNVPLLRGAGAIAQESLIQAERNLIYRARSFERFRRGYLVDIANDYFALLQAKQAIANQQRQIDSLEQFTRATRARVEAGRLEAFQTLIAEDQLSSALSALTSLRESYLLALDRFKVRLGLGLDDVLDVTEADLALPEPDVFEEDSARLALEYRLDLQNARDQLDDTRRGVLNAKDALLPDLNLSGNITIPTDDDNRHAGLSLSPDDLSYSVGATLSLPLDRRTQELNLRQARIGLERAKRDYDRTRDDIIVSARSAARAIDVARRQLTLAESQVESARRRLRAQKLQEDVLQPQQIVDSENALLSAENSRDQARTNLRRSVLNYLLQTDQLRVNRDGTLRMLPGM